MIKLNKNALFLNLFYLLMALLVILIQYIFQGRLHISNDFTMYLIILTLVQTITMGVPIVLYFAISSTYNSQFVSANYPVKFKDIFSIKRISLKICLILIPVMAATIVSMYTFRNLVYNVYYLLTGSKNILNYNIIVENDLIPQMSALQIIIAVLIMALILNLLKSNAVIAFH